MKLPRWLRFGKKDAPATPPAPSMQAPPEHEHATHAHNVGMPATHAPQVTTDAPATPSPESPKPSPPTPKKSGAKPAAQKAGAAKGKKK